MFTVYGKDFLIMKIEADKDHYNIGDPFSITCSYDLEDVIMNTFVYNIFVSIYIK